MTYYVGFFLFNLKLTLNNLKFAIYPELDSENWYFLQKSQFEQKSPIFEDEF